MGTANLSKHLVLFLHGLGAHRHSFDLLIKELGDLQDRSEFVALDFWGFGGTQLPAGLPKVSIGALAEQVAREISARNPDGRRAVHLVGHAMGGTVAVWLHRLHREIPIASFACLEGALQHQDRDPAAGRKIVRISRKKFGEENFVDFKEEAAKQALVGSASSRDLLEGLNHTTPLVYYEAVVDIARVVDEVYPIYRDWDTRKLFVFGEKTLKLTSATYHRLVKDGQSVTVIPGAGHGMMVDKPAATAEALRDFWRS